MLRTPVLVETCPRISGLAIGLSFDGLTAGRLPWQSEGLFFPPWKGRSFDTGGLNSAAPLFQTGACFREADRSLIFCGDQEEPGRRGASSLRLFTLQAIYGAWMSGTTDHSSRKCFGAAVDITAAPMAALGSGRMMPLVGGRS